MKSPRQQSPGNLSNSSGTKGWARQRVTVQGPLCPSLPFLLPQPGDLHAQTISDHANPSRPSPGSPQASLLAPGMGKGAGSLRKGVRRDTSSCPHGQSRILLLAEKTPLCPQGAVGGGGAQVRGESSPLPRYGSLAVRRCVPPQPSLPQEGGEVSTAVPGRPRSPGKPRSPAGPSFPGLPAGPGSP